MGAFWTFFYGSTTEGSELKKVYETFYGKNTVFLKGHFQGTLLFFPCWYSSSNDTYQVSIVRSNRWSSWKSYWRYCRPKISNARFLTTDAAHTPMTPSSLFLFGILERFLMYLMTSSVNIKGNCPKPTRTGNLKPSLAFSKIWG